MITNRTIEKRTKYYSDKIQKVQNFNHLNKNVSKKGQIVFVGDSITDFFPLSDYFSDTINKTGLEIYNRGISGDTTNRLYERFQENVLSIEPKIIVILIGTNDLGVGAPVKYPIKYIDKILSMIKSQLHDTKVILQAVYPVNKITNKMCVNRRKNIDIINLNLKLKTLSEKYNYIYVDLTDKLKDGVGNLKKEYSFDGLHPNAQGYTVIAKELSKYLCE